jgi:alkanesulfonate monooxygenase SsuD/methylene tetrahydromethanopterin reductase-like flavin-dependent oxidoreductase (luciferase family)
VQRPWPPILVGGESAAALRRSARFGDGWIGMNHDFDSGARQIGVLRTLLTERHRDPDDFEFCLGGPVSSPDDVTRWEELGVTRLIVAPWARSKEAVDGMRRFAAAMRLAP